MASLVRILLLTSAIFCFHWAEAEGFAHLTMHSPPGERIGRGQDWDITYHPSTATFFSANLFQYISGSPAFIELSFWDPAASTFYNYSLMQFSTLNLGVPITEGAFYPHVQRPGDEQPGNAGVFVAFQGRATQTQDGFLKINSVAYTPSGSSLALQYLDVEFGQVPENSTLMLTGRIVYSAVPEPASLTVLAMGAFGLLKRRRTVREA